MSCMILFTQNTQNRDLKNPKTRKYRFMVDNCLEKGDWRAKTSVSFGRDVQLLELDGAVGCTLFLCALCH